MTKAFVVCCKDSNYIRSCVSNIRNHYPLDKIYIVDSDSDDKSYFSIVNDFQSIYILDAYNKNYECGAYLYWYELYGDQHDTYIFMQDSINIINSIHEIDRIEDNNVIVFYEEKTGWQKASYHNNVWYTTNTSFPNIDIDDICMTIWNSFCINRSTFMKVINSDIFKLASLPNNKILSAAWERIWSAIFKENHISISAISQNKIYKLSGKRI